MRFLFALIALSAALVVGAQAAPQEAAPSELQITNLRVGLVCPHSHSERGSICFDATQVPITGQGTCVYAGQEYPCTWYGFEFDYTGARPGDELACVITSSSPVSYGNPIGPGEQNVARAEYRLPLENSAGHFYNPQYTLSGPHAPNISSVTNETVCSFGGREMFRFHLEVQYPPPEK